MQLITVAFQSSAFHDEAHYGYDSFYDIMILY